MTAESSFRRGGTLVCGADSRQQRAVNVLGALALGFLAGTTGALLPGPLALALVSQKAPRPRLFLPARLGPLISHFVVCIAVGLAVGPMFRVMSGSTLLRTVLAASYVACAIALVAREIAIERDPEWSPPSGLALAAAWILLIGFAARASLVDGFAASLVLAGGVWLGAASWCVVLSVLSSRINAWGAERCLRVLALTSAALLLVLGVYVGRHVPGT
jgi:hypothetical protein